MHAPSSSVLPRRLLASLCVLALLATGCAAGAEASAPDLLRLGYLPNVTHAPAVLGVEDGTFEAALGPDVDFDPRVFNAGPDVIEALLSGALDAAYIGPNPAVNGYARSDGEALRIVAGATSGGAGLVVRPGIDAASDLRGATLATPQLGNTQDVALRAWLADEGLATSLRGGGEVTITPQANGQALEAFQAGAIDGAWVPEPWLTRMVAAGGQLLVDEADLFEDGRFVTTHLIVRTAVLRDQPELVRRLLEGHLDALDATTDDPVNAQRRVAVGIEQVTGSRLDPEVLATAWERLTFTADPIPEALHEVARDAVALGVSEPVDLDGIYDLTILDQLLTARGEPEVTP